jgi:hypothetical protein
VTHLLAVLAALFAPQIGDRAAFRPLPGTHGDGCTSIAAARDVAHLELFARGHIVVLPAGIGVRAPRRRGAYVVGGRCSHAVRTTEPTGLVEVRRGTRATLGDLFATWGRRLDARALLGFHGRVRAYVDGRRWRGDPRDVTLRRHAQVVVAVGPAVPVHARYTFPPGR